MKSIFKTFQFLLFALLLSQCECDEILDKKEVLPPVTQVGANTFGCMINEKLWLPKGNDGNANLDASYDLYYSGGSLDINAYRIADGQNQFFSFGGINISSTGEFILSKTDNSPGALFTDQASRCSYIGPSHVVSGKFIITVLDMQKGIVSGTFEFTLSGPSCDTIKINDGRFDLKI